MPRPQENENIEVQDQKPEIDTKNVPPIEAVKIDANNEVVKNLISQALDQQKKELETSFDKQIEDMMIKFEESKPAPETTVETVNIKENGVANFAETILEKRKKEREDTEKLRAQKEREDMERELNTYRLEKKLGAMFKEEPYMEEPILEAMKEGVIKSETDIKIYFNSAVKNRLKMAWAYEQATKKAGADPMDIYKENNIVTEEIANNQKFSNDVESWKKDLGIV